MPDQRGQFRGNSGVMIHGTYEVQILDSYNNPTYANRSCGVYYGHDAPLVNAGRPPDERQSYDMTTRRPAPAEYHGPARGVSG
jgi:3-keto-disaccharide hydrolase